MYKCRREGVKIVARQGSYKVEKQFSLGQEDDQLRSSSVTGYTHSTSEQSRGDSIYTLLVQNKGLRSNLTNQS